MRNSKFKYLSIALLLGVCFQAMGQDKLTWQQAIEIAITENTDLKVATINLEATQKNIGIAASGFTPNVVVQANYTTSAQATFSENFGVLPQHTGLVGGQVSQMIYNEQILGNHAIQKYLYQSAESQLELTKNKTVFLAGQAYINFLMAQDLLAVQDSNLVLTERNLQASRDRLEFGAANQQEVLRWETQVYAAQQKVEQQKSSLLYNQTNFNNTLNFPLEQTHELASLDISTNGFIFKSELIGQMVNDPDKSVIIRNYLVDVAMFYSPLIPATEKQVLALERMRKMNGRWAIPSVSIAGGGAAKWLTEGSGSEGVDGSEFWKYGVMLSWNLFDGGKSLKKASQTKLQLEASKLEQSNAYSNLEQAIRSLTGILIKDYNNVALALKQAEAADKNYDLVYDSYMLGESSLINLIDAQEQKLGAEIQSKTVYYTFLLNLLQLEQAIGYFPFYHVDLSETEFIKDLENRLLTQ